jgi:hypothetical protein
MAPLTAAARLRAAVAGVPVPVRAWAVSRALVLALAVVFSLTIGLAPRGPDPGVADLFVLQRYIDPAVPSALVLLGDWDVTWYLDIARHGYARDLGQVGVIDSNLAFFPLVPGIMAAFLALGVNPFIGMLVVANLAFLGALAGLHALTRRHLSSERLADRATWALALLPPTAFAAMAYTEAVVLACALAAALLATRGRFALAGSVAAVAALSRPPGIIVAVLVALIALTGPRPARARNIALALAPAALALALFGLWMWAERGSPTLPLQAQGAWDRGQVGLGIITALPSEWVAAADQIVHLDADSRWTSAARDVLFSALYVALLARLWRDEGGLRSPWVGYSLVALAIPLSTGSFASMARFGILAFPLMWPLAAWLDASPRRRRWAGAAAVVVMALLVAQLRIRAP